ncbi:hypothetical protein KJ764_00640 [Patescibacteria group bacterium]|nr:hypothetical protein [Patescibacteria group bacterium]
MNQPGKSSSADKIYIPGKETQCYIRHLLPKAVKWGVVAVAASVCVLAGLVKVDRDASGVTKAAEVYGTGWTDCKSHWSDFERGCSHDASQAELVACMDDFRTCLAGKGYGGSRPTGYCSDLPEEPAVLTVPDASEVSINYR